MRSSARKLIAVLVSIQCVAAAIAADEAARQAVPQSAQEPSSVLLLAGVRDYPAGVLRSLLLLADQPLVLRQLATDPSLLDKPGDIKPAVSEEIASAIRAVREVPDIVGIAADQPALLKELQKTYEKSPERAEQQLGQLRTAYAQQDIAAAAAWQKALEADSAALDEYRALLNKLCEEQKKAFDEFQCVRVLNRDYYLALTPDEGLVAFVRQNQKDGALARVLEQWFKDQSPRARDARVIGAAPQPATPPSTTGLVIAESPEERAKMWQPSTKDGQGGLGLVPVILQPPADQPVEARFARAAAEHARLWYRVGGPPQQAAAPQSGPDSANESAEAPASEGSASATITGAAPTPSVAGNNADSSAPLDVTSNVRTVDPGIAPAPSEPQQPGGGANAPAVVGEAPQTNVIVQTEQPLPQPYGGGVVETYTPTPVYQADDGNTYVQNTYVTNYYDDDDDYYYGGYGYYGGYSTLFSGYFGYWSGSCYSYGWPYYSGPWYGGGGCYYPGRSCYYGSRYYCWRPSSYACGPRYYGSNAYGLSVSTGYHPSNVYGLVYGQNGHGQSSGYYRPNTWTGGGEPPGHGSSGGHPGAIGTPRQRYWGTLADAPRKADVRAGEGRGPGSAGSFDGAAPRGGGSRSITAPSLLGRGDSQRGGPRVDAAGPTNRGVAPRTLNNGDAPRASNRNGGTPSLLTIPTRTPQQAGASGNNGGRTPVARSGSTDRATGDLANRKTDVRRGDGSTPRTIRQWTPPIDNGVRNSPQIRSTNPQGGSDSRIAPQIRSGSTPGTQAPRSAPAIRSGGGQNSQAPRIAPQVRSGSVPQARSGGNSAAPAARSAPRMISPGRSSGGGGNIMTPRSSGGSRPATVGRSPSAGRPSSAGSFRSSSPRSSGGGSRSFAPSRGGMSGGGGRGRGR